MADQRQDMPSRKRIEQLELRYRKVAKLLTGALAFMLLAVIVGFFIIRGVINDVQHERYRNVLSSCQQTNERHDDTVRELDVRLRLAEPTLSRQARAQLEQTRDFTVALIDALAPVRPDCRAYARDLVSS